MHWACNNHLVFILGILKILTRLVCQVWGNSLVEKIVGLYSYSLYRLFSEPTTLRPKMKLERAIRKQVNFFTGSSQSTMGTDSSKDCPSRPKKLADLGTMSKYTPGELQCWYREFTRTRPHKYITTEEFVETYLRYFPKGNYHLPYTRLNFGIL